MSGGFLRDFVIIAFVLGTLPFCFIRPWVGVLVFIWISIMNPHRLTWGPAYGFPFAQIVAITTLAGVLFLKSQAKFPRERETWIILALAVLVTITSLFALVPSKVWYKWTTVTKIYIMTIVPLFLLQEQRRLRYLLLTLALSICFFSVKGGIFSILTKGQYTVFGPPLSFIGDNNALALAELMVLPLLVYLARSEPRLWFRTGLRIAAFLTLVSVIFSYSRGALLGLIAVVCTYLVSLRKFGYAILLGIVVLGSLPFVPERWFQRMETIGTYQEDESAMGRINAWKFALNVALDRPLTGGGFRTFDNTVYLRYAPDPFNVLDAHSIYFEILGEHGFLGLGLFLLLLGSCFVSLRQVDHWSRGMPSLTWTKDYSAMLRLSLIAYAVGGAFLGLAYFDLYFDLVIGVVLLKILAREQWRALRGSPAAPPMDTAAPRRIGSGVATHVGGGRVGG